MWRLRTRTSFPRGVGPALLGLTGLACRQDMHDQPRYKPLAVSTFFADGMAARELVPGTVPRGASQHDPSFYTGRSAALPPAPAPLPPSAPQDREQLAAWRAIAAAQAVNADAQPDERQYTDVLPFPLTLQVLTRGQERFGIYCAVCHDDTGSGNGMIVRKGFSRPPTLHSDRLRSVRLGHFFDVMTNGFGAMPAYAAQLLPADRWAVAGYLRALQLSQHVQRSALPAAQQRELGKTGGGTP